MAPQNRLAREKSPYLLQHKNNPVDWYPWGPEAFARARAEDKPIFLSIGYATCHWCHVMERESFEDPQTAALLNDAFVCVKVDREERPDVDQTYMRVCQMITGSGGWPLTILLTPDAKPFFAATYIPREERFGRPGLRDLVPRVKELWTTNRIRLVESAEDITRHLQTPRPTTGKTPDASTLDAAAEQLATLYDPVHGGFGGPPKFPTPHQLTFLLRYADRTANEDHAERVHHTLRSLRRGGIFDHVGFGFHRYATDREWFLPHFEKMLYDQALLLNAYLEAYQRTREPEFAGAAHDIIVYVLRELTDAGGAFYCAEDADSEGVEGKYYAWTWNELTKRIPAPALAWIAPLFGLVPEGNLRDEAHGTPTGTNHFHLTDTWEATGRRTGRPVAQLQREWNTIREDLLAARSRRVRPLRDDKILTDWNGLMIGALARAARILDEPRYAAAASRAAEFIHLRMRDNRGRLLHRYRDGDAAILGFLDDHAFLAHGLLELYEATGDVRHLASAEVIAKDMRERFWNDKDGGFEFASGEHETLVGSTQDWYDGAVPSGNSVALLVLLRLGRMLGRPDLERTGNDLLRAAAAQVARGPAGHAQLLIGLDFALGPTREIVLAGPDAASVAPLRAVVDAEYLPRAVLLTKTPEQAHRLASLAPFTRDLNASGGRATAFLCEDYRCDLPRSDPAALRRALTQPTKAPAGPRSDDSGASGH